MIDGTVVLLTALSGLALLVLLAALAIALWQIQAALDRINQHVAKIHWGVRAIERETDGLRSGLPELRATLTDVVAGAGVIAQALDSAGRRLASAAEALGGPRA